MNITDSVKTCLIALGLCWSVSLSAGEVKDDYISEARPLVKQFGGQLKGRLMAAMKEGGPVQAISVCNTAAPEIAASLSTQGGWRVARTALKLRNPDNAPDAWEEKVLQETKEIRVLQGIGGPGAQRETKDL